MAMQNGLGDTNVWVISALVLGLLLGWLFGWLSTRARARAELEAAASAKADIQGELDEARHTLAEHDTRLAEQESQNETLLKQKAVAEQNTQELQNDFDDLTAKIELLESSQSESSDEIQALEDTIASLENKLEADRAALQAETEKLLAEKNKELTTLNDELGALKGELAASKDAQSASVKHALAENEALVSALKNENEGLVADKHSLAQQLQAATAQIDETQTTLEQTKAALSVREQADRPNTSQLSYLQDQVSELKQLRDNLRGEISRLESSLALWQHKHARAQEALSSAEQNIATLQQTLEDSSQTDPSYERLLKIKDQEILKHKEQAHAVQTRLISAHEEVKAREFKINELNGALEKLHNRDRRELASATQRLEQQQTAQAEERRTHAARAESLQQDKTQLENSITTINRDLQQTQQEIKRLREEQRELSRQLNETKSELAQKNRDTVEYAQRNAELDAQIAALQSELDSEHHRYAELSKDRQAKLNVNQTLHADIAQQHQEIVALKQKLAAAEKARVTAAPTTAAKSSNADESRPANLLNKKPAKADDLKRISGVGPKLETMLNKLGIYRFSQIAEFKAKDVAWVDQHIETFKGRIYRDEWVKQAKKLAKE